MIKGIEYQYDDYYDLIILKLRAIPHSYHSPYAFSDGGLGGRPLRRECSIGIDSYILGYVDMLIRLNRIIQR